MKMGLMKRMITRAEVEENMHMPSPRHVAAGESVVSVTFG
jgi:hypothetical protein